MQIRPAAPPELAAVGELTVAAYVSDGYLEPTDDYVAELADARGRTEHATVLVAVDETHRLLGTVTYCLAGTPYAEVSLPGEAEFRMLAVAPEARGRGVGTALAQACIDVALAGGCTAIALCSLKTMRTAHRMYERFGFVRTPDRDWQPHPEVTLIAYVLPLRPQDD